MYIFQPHWQTYQHAYRKARICLCMCVGKKDIYARVSQPRASAITKFKIFTYFQAAAHPRCHYPLQSARRAQPAPSCPQSHVFGPPVCESLNLGERLPIYVCVCGLLGPSVCVFLSCACMRSVPSPSPPLPPLHFTYFIPADLSNQS